MSNPSNPPEPGSNQPISTEGWFDAGPRNAQLIYILYFASIITGLTALVGVVMAYLNRGKAGGYVETHYTWLIRTFWIGILFSLISFILAFVGIGFLLMIAVAVWVIIRLVKGIQALGRGEPISDPLTWWI
ncbi:DUF4870 family protein [Oceaniradius stylonematis]|uniref:DUF4870 family protein n=1 Tax=Oceaniradius stylonematis TaxID=2184161 RepID=UPI00273DAC37|nr:hypothetical protein [Oceaniradius stylonematis]